MRKLQQFACILVVSGQLIVTAGAQTRLGSANLGSSTTATAIISISGSGTLSSIDVVTQGATGLDFTNAGTGTCKIGTAYTAGTTCTVGVKFKPLFAGNRYGAVVLHSSSSLLGTGFLQGYGVGPQIAFNPSLAIAINPVVPASLPRGLLGPLGIAVDGAGNLYITSNQLQGVALVPANGGAPSIFDPSADGSAVGNDVSSIAIDGAGNIFLNDLRNSRVVEARPDGSTAAFVDPYAEFPNLNAVAVDGAGDLFILDAVTSNVIEYPGGNSESKPKAISVTVDGQPLVKTGGGPTALCSMAIDASGNLFVADEFDPYVVELTAAQVAGGGGDGTLIAPVVGGEALNGAGGVAFDGAGNLFITDVINSRVVVVPAAGAAAYAIHPTANGEGLFFPDNLASDGAGSLFIADTDNNRVVQVQRSHGPDLSFANKTPIGSVSADSPEVVQVQNSGTGALNITGLSYAPDFPEDTAGSNPCSTSTSLSSEEICNLNIDFLPLSLGTFNENVTITDNALNANGSKQTVGVSGTSEDNKLRLSAGSLSYGVQQIGTASASQQVTVTSNATSPLPITGIHVTGPSASAFIFANNCPSTLAVGASCIIHGHYSPTTENGDSAAVIITYAGGSESISLSGQGAFPPIAYLEETSLSFGTQEVGTQSASQYAKLVSDGDLPLHILGFHITGPNASSFIFASDCPAYLAPPNYCHFHGHFAPTTTGPLKAFLTFTMADNAAPSPVTLTGTGTSQPTTISLSPTTLDFGTVNVGSSSASQRVSLTNKSVSVLDVAGISVTGPNASSFVFANDCQPMVLAGQACSIHGHFTPTAKGPLTAVLTLTDSGVGSPQSITLKGTGQ